MRGKRKKKILIYQSKIKYGKINILPRGEKYFEFYRLFIPAAIRYRGSDLLHITEKDQVVFPASDQHRILLQLEQEAVAIHISSSYTGMGGWSSD